MCGISPWSISDSEQQGLITTRKSGTYTRGMGQVHWQRGRLEELRNSTATTTLIKRQGSGCQSTLS